jgi:PHD/YefM family antitoxin component YafN of YafNO toxin-antitoxin module
MTDLITATLGKDFLTSDTAFSDRFVYSNYFVPLLVNFDEQSEVAILPFYAKKHLLEVAIARELEPSRIKQLLGVDGWDDNDMDAAVERMQAYANGERRRNTAANRPAARGGSVKTHVPRPHIPEADPDEPQRPTVLEPVDEELIAGLLRSTIGYVFLDRTRIRPMGFAIGEHVYALGLAPNEEVVLEQKAFTKRQSTFEEQSEQEKQFDIEFSSTYTTELQEGLERQRSLTDAWGLGLSHSGSYQSPATPYGQFNASHTVSYTKNVTEASQESSRRSVKDGQTASAKVSGRYRAQHKTMFKVTKEEGFETSSKRTIRNPNRATPITLHYFKVLQRLQMKQERYGARLCWAPAVANPARTFLGKIAAGHKRVIDDAMAQLPPKPLEPQAPPKPQETTSTNRQTTIAWSEWVQANKWGATGDMSADYDIDVPIGDGWSWGGSVGEIQVLLDTKRTNVAANIVGNPVPIAGGLRVRVHVGAGSWFMGPGISIQVGVTCFKDVTITNKAAENTGYLAAVEDWRMQTKEWERQRDEALEHANAAADAFAAEMRAKLSPVNEMISQIIEDEFDTDVRDEVWEVEYWQRLFDWERASFVTYPSWWAAEQATPDPTLDPSSFINASWAKLYLPVRAGMERAALRWIHGKAVAKPMDSKSEKAFDRVIADLETYREDKLGSRDEQPKLTKVCQLVDDPFLCLAQWYEVMPTDGTHLEVVHAATTAADADTRTEIDDAAAMRKALNASEERSAQIKDKAITKMTGAAKVDVHVGADGGATS